MRKTPPQCSGYDIVIDCCDNFATRYLIDDTCRALGKPWVHGTIGGFDGRVTTFLPGANPDSPTFTPNARSFAPEGQRPEVCSGRCPEPSEPYRHVRR